MLKFVNAKINLGLNIINKREDGYHDLETVFYPIGLDNGTPVNPEQFCDILEINNIEGNDDEFYYSGNVIECPLEKNLVYKAVNAFKQETNFIGHFSVWLDKHIPDGAGLGGGSADASFTLGIVNALAHHPLEKKQLLELAGKLGADCPFFLENRPVLATGIGDIMMPFDLNLSSYWGVVVKPDIYISTKEAFAGICPSIPQKSLREILHYPVDEWEERGLINDFEPHIFQLHPTLADIKTQLYTMGAQYAAMSGSGSSIFGIFSSHKTAVEAKNQFNTYKVFLTSLSLNGIS